MKKKRHPARVYLSDSPQFNGVAERALGLLEAATMAARIQATDLFPDVNMPDTKRL